MLFLNLDIQRVNKKKIKLKRFIFKEDKVWYLFYSKFL